MLVQYPLTSIDYKDSTWIKECKYNIKKHIRSSNRRSFILPLKKYCSPRPTWTPPPCHSGSSNGLSLPTIAIHTTPVAVPQTEPRASTNQMFAMTSRYEGYNLSSSSLHPPSLYASSTSSSPTPLSPTASDCSMFSGTWGSMFLESPSIPGASFGSCIEVVQG